MDIKSYEISWNDLGSEYGERRGLEFRGILNLRVYRGEEVVDLFDFFNYFKWIFVMIYFL